VQSFISSISTSTKIKKKDKFGGGHIQFLRSIFHFFLSILTILLIGSIPFLLNGSNIEWSRYIKGIDLTFKSLISLDIYYYAFNTTPRPLFPDVWKPYLYSMFLLVIALIISILLGIIISVTIRSLPFKWREHCRRVFFISESIPDILIAVCMQALVIWFYQKTGILLVNVASAFEEQAITIPLLTLCILPTLFISRMLTLRLLEEGNEEYAHFAISKGLNKKAVILKHILPNTLFSLFSQSRYLIWFILSNLVMVEYIFNIYGLTTFLIRFSSPEVFTACIILVFIPLYLLVVISNRLLQNRVGGVI
jgi:ABC-type dipeptide/oligopeptide/nickel transport system permease component